MGLVQRLLTLQGMRLAVFTLECGSSSPEHVRPFQHLTVPCFILQVTSSLRQGLHFSQKHALQSTWLLAVEQMFPTQKPE